MLKRSRSMAPAPPASPNAERKTLNAQPLPLPHSSTLFTPTPSTPHSHLQHRPIRGVVRPPVDKDLQIRRNQPISLSTKDLVV